MKTSFAFHYYWVFSEWKSSAFIQTQTSILCTLRVRPRVVLLLLSKQRSGAVRPHFTRQGNGCLPTQASLASQPLEQTSMQFGQTDLAPTSCGGEKNSLHESTVWLIILQTAVRQASKLNILLGHHFWKVSLKWFLAKSSKHSKGKIDLFTLIKGRYNINFFLQGSPGYSCSIFQMLRWTAHSEAGSRRNRLIIKMPPVMREP